jgi:hypothetical protein
VAKEQRETAREKRSGRRYSQGEAVPPVTYFLQLSPTSGFHHLPVMSSNDESITGS